MTTPSTKKIMLTIDVEDWFQVENLRPWFPPNTWNQQILRVEKNTYRLLNLLDSTNQVNPKATFFVLGWVAEKAPGLVREINRRGHEVASHGYGHMMCSQLDRKDLEKDLISSKHLLEDTIGREVKGYRAPNFSISDQALTAIQSAEYQYDSSFNNFSRHGRYGRISLNGCQRSGVAFEMANGFIELPISNLIFGGQTLPWGGGGYFRFLPFPIFKAGIRKIFDDNDAYVFYMHPWEIDPDQPRIREVKGLSRWRHYINLDKAQYRLAQMITSFKRCQFITCSQYIESQNH